MEHHKLLIIGSGPAGLTAAIYACRAGLSPLLIEGTLPGGQLTQTTTVDNFPGFPEGIEGYDLMENMRQQALRFGCLTRQTACLRADFSGRPLRVWTDDGGEFTADSIIISTGAHPRTLGLEGESRLMGHGLSVCATCDGFFYRRKRVAVVGGGDTAAEEATYLAGLAEKVYVIVRKPYLRASQAMQERVKENAKIEVLYEHQVEALLGDDRLEGISLVSRKGEADESHRELHVDGLFFAIGHDPESAPFREWMDTDEAGFITTLPHSTATTVPGVFAAGDVANPQFRQAIVAAGTGAKAAIEAERYLALLPS